MSALYGQFVVTSSRVGAQACKRIGAMPPVCPFQSASHHAFSARVVLFRGCWCESCVDEIMLVHWCRSAGMHKRVIASRRCWCWSLQLLLRLCNIRLLRRLELGWC